MEIVQQFNAELSSLYEVRPPISKAKMSQITRVSMKAVKMYKHIVQSVERFIVKCRPEYKIPGLYVIDSIVRQSRHQFGVDKDVYAARFARNFASTFQNLFLTCPPDDKPKIVRVLNLWQRNNVFSAETIQPLLDMANPNASLTQMKFEGSPQTSGATRETNRDNRESNSSVKDSNIMIQLQQLANSLGLGKSGNSSSSNFNESQQMETQNTIKFNKKLLDFDYGDEEDEDERGETPTEAEPPLRSGGIVDDNNVTNPLALSMAQNLLSNPELLQQLQQMHKTIQQTELLKLSISELESHGMVTDINPAILSQSAIAGQQFLNQFNQSQQSSQSIAINESSDDTNQNKRNEIINAFENTMETKLNIDNNIAINENNFQYLQNANFTASQSRVNDLNFAPNNSIDAQKYHQQQQFHQQYHQEMNERSGSQSPRSRSPRRSRFNRYREKSRSRSRNRRDREREPNRRSYRSRSRSPQQSRNNSRFESSRNNDRSRSPASYERDRERERRRRGLPPIRKGYLTICSTTLWLGHVPKLASEADLSDSFGEFGTITSIDLIPPRGCAYVCMNRRQDASKALSVMRNMKLHGSIIKMAWAPGKGMKGKEYKDYWEAENGASYIPYSRIPDDVDLDLLEEGGTVDEDTVPEKLQELRKLKNKEREEKEREAAAVMMARATLIPMPLVSIPNSTFNVSTGLVMPTNMIFTQTGQTSAMPVQTSSETPVTSILTGVTQNYSHLTSVPSLPSGNDDINNQLMDMNDVQSNPDTNLILNESHSEPLLSSHPSMPSPNASLLPPPLPSFQPPPLGIPPPPIIGGQPPPRLPWLSAPHSMATALNAQQMHTGARIPVNAGAIRTPLLPSSSALTSPTSTSSYRSDDISIPQTHPKPEDRPPLIATLPIPIHHEDLSNLHELPPRLHQDRNFSGRERFRPNADMDRHRSNDDPFAPSVYELRAMERNSIMRPPIPHQMHSGASGMRPMMPQNMNERFPFDNRPPQRQFHPRQQHHHNIRPNMHSNYDRHGNLRNTNRGGRDHYAGGGAGGGGGGGGRGANFNRRDRPSRWKNDERDRHFNRSNDFHYNKQKYQHHQQNEDNEDNDEDNDIIQNNSDNSNNNNNDNNISNNDTNVSNFGDSDTPSEMSDLKSNTNDSSYEQLEPNTQNASQSTTESANSPSNT